MARLLPCHIFFVFWNGVAFSADEQLKKPLPFQEFKKNIRFLSGNGEDSTCQTQIDFLKLYEFDTLYIVFAGSFPQSPSSAFGHLFILLSPPKEKKTPLLLWNAVNYMAETGNVGSFTKFVKGIAGGFDGSFQFLPYHEKLRQYTGLEDRDIWLFPILTTQEERRLLLTRLYELQNTRFQYWFFTRNCAYQIQLLLSEVLENYPSPRNWFVGPQNVIESLEKYGRLCRPTQVMAMKSKIHQIIMEHSSDQDVKFRTLLGDGFPQDTMRLEELKEKEASLLLEFIEWKLTKRKMHLTPKEQSSLFWLRRRIYNTDSSNVSTPSASVAENKPEAHPYARFGIAWTSTSFQEPAIGLSFRPALHEASDCPVLYSRYNSYDLLSFESRVQAHSARIEEFYLFRQYSFPPSDRMFPELSWKLSLGTVRHRVDGQRLLHTGLEWGVGKSITFDRRQATIISLMISGSIWHIENKEALKMFIGPEINTFILTSEHWRLGSTALFLFGEKIDSAIYYNGKIWASIDLSHHWSLFSEVGVDNSREIEMSAGLRIYID